MQFRPCIDLHQGKVKQIVGSSITDTGAATNFVSDKSPASYAELYRRDHLTGGHVIKLGPGNDEAALEALRTWPGGLQIGGGITPENAEFYLSAGASAVIVTSYLFDGGELSFGRLRELSRAVPRERLVLDLSCRKRDGKYWIVRDLWRQFTSLQPTPVLLEDLSEYACEFLIHAVDVEGKQSGIDGTLIGHLAEHCPIPAVYAGGISSLEDVRTIHREGKGRIHFTVGSALDLFGGPLSYDAVRDLAASLP